jgi:Zn-dependent peptidase ImmA (M78 family)/transcriptional regulator with XRE-family HTH domain
MDILSGSMTVTVPINGAIIEWARTRRNIPLSQLETSVGATAEQIAQWASNKVRPPLGKAQKLANALKIPFGYLFLSNHPTDEIPLPDLRTRTDRPPSSASADFIETVNDVLRKQEWYREYSEQNAARKVPVIGTFTIAAGIEAVAGSIRSALNIEQPLRDKCETWSKYLSTLSRNAERTGILIMRTGMVKGITSRPLSEDEFEGFAIYDPVAPVAFINGRDSVTAQIFTLAHELAHLWIGKSAISDVSEETAPARHGVELFCHRVATETLVPAVEFSTVWRSSVNREFLIKSLASRFWVSTTVILRRALELGKISQQEFFDLLANEKQKQQRRKPSGGDPYRNLVNRNSVPLVNAVLFALRQDRLLYRDAARVLDISFTMLDGLVERRRPK